MTGWQAVPGLVEVSHLLLLINSSLNFPVYFLASGARLSALLSGWRRSSSSTQSTTAPPSLACETSNTALSFHTQSTTAPPIPN